MRKKGFTLIELLVVIAIIGMLAGIVLVSMTRVRARGRDAKRMSDIRQWSTAMTLAYDDSSSNCGGPDAFPTSTTILNAICPNGPYYLNPTPTTTGGRAYGWINNTGTGDDQRFCVYANLEIGGYFVATEKGTKELSSCPTSFATCW